MQSHVLRVPIQLAALLAFAIFQLTFNQTGATFADQDLAREPLPSSWKQDAELTDVFFLNADLGWAVGAQGVIIRTTDGGKSWSEISQAFSLAASELSLSQKFRNMRSGVRSSSTGIADGSSDYNPIRCRFESVHFVDEKHGWVAGGYEVPYVGRSRAVVMRTQDGGLSWEAIKNLVVPRFSRIHFSDPVSGWAIGKTGNLFQSGIFYTSDGGRSWSSQSSGKLHAWTDAEQTSTGFVTVNCAGRLGVINASEYEASVILRDSGSRVSQVRMLDDKTGWAVGQNGTLLQTANGGLSWSPAEVPQIAKMIEAFDLETLSITDQKIWLAGDPGSFLFSVDRTTGQATANRTPINTRINKVYFTDDQTGWAVGALGAVIATQDGGKTWKRQRGTNRQAAMLLVAADDESLPFEILSKYATEENRICASLILRDSIDEKEIATQATERLGSVMTFAIATDATGQTREGVSVNRQHIVKKLVRVLRTMQPFVVVCNSGQLFSSAAESPTSNPVTLVRDAIRLAADQNAFPEMIAATQLKPWQVNRLAIRDPTGTVNIDPHRLLPRTGVLIEDQIAISRALSGESVIVDDAAKYRVTHFTSRDRISAGDLLSGLTTPSSIPSRKSANSKRGNLTMIQQANAKQQEFKRFVNFEANTPHDMLVWRQQVQSLALKMEKDVAGVWLTQLAERYLTKGKTELAANALSMMVTRWPDHAFAPAGLTWLAQYYASDEFGQIEFLNRVRSGQLLRNGQPSQAQQIKNEFATTPQVVHQGGVSQLVWAPTQVPPATGPDPAIALASGEESDNNVGRPAMFEERLRTASHYLTQLRRRDPELVASSQYQLLAAQISQRVAGVLANEGQLKSLVQKREFGGAGVSIGARRELGLRGLLPANEPVELLECQQTEQRPQLDGKLDEAFWQTAINNGNAVFSTVYRDDNSQDSRRDVAVFAYDDQFLYAGFTCHKIQGQYYKSRKQPRPRDADLTRRDRVELEIDVDRDYHSANRFVVDHRGWVRESCTGSHGWNPDWYVSQSEDETSWTVEFAIPLEQIVPGKTDPETTWAFRIARRAFDQTNLWDRSDESVSTPTGLQMGLMARPADFQLMRLTPVDDAIASE